MRVRSASKRSQSGQAICMFTIMLMFVLVPMVGLAIDGGRGYLVRLKLSSAVDGGALAAARLMSSGGSAAQQQSYAMATAVQYVQANFPNGYFGASLVSGSNGATACVDPGTDSSDPCHVNGSGGVSTYKVRTVALNGSANMNALFMGIIGIPTINVNASGVASRRDVRVMLIIDRSSSMSGYFGTSSDSIIPMATAFVKSFSGSSDFGGRDEVGLVVFGGSGIVAYPARHIANDFTDYTQFTPPDNNFKINSNGAIIKNGSDPGYLSQINYGSHTGTAEGLYLAYMTLRADAATNTDLSTKLNVIVLFTDGIPNGITAFANDPGLATAAGRQDFMLSLPGTSGCADIAAGKGAVTTPPVGGTNMIGWFEQNNGNQQSSTSTPNGLFPNMMAYAYSNSHTGNSGKTTGAGDDIGLYLSHADADDNSSETVKIPQWSDGPCTSTNPMNKTVAVMRSFPRNDLYGNYIDLVGHPPPAVSGLTMPTGPSGKPLYQSGTLWSTSTQCNSEIFSMTDVADGCQVGLASWQALAHQAWKVWNQIVWSKATQTNILDPAPNQSNPVIFTIGFSHDASDLPDMNLLQIVANDPASPVPYSSRVNGKAYLASDPNSVASAFTQIESEILRLAK
ncbi:MAG TPA: TadE/TadG family protein [Bryobacteraceae bacterium]|nr:TadE/TadG family protein [Bryobacteraceae bacterium]